MCKLNYKVNPVKVNPVKHSFYRNSQSLIFTKKILIMTKMIACI